MFIRNGDDDGRENFEFVGLGGMEWRAFRWDETGVPSFSLQVRLGRKHSATLGDIIHEARICVFRVWWADNRVE